ncbi:hypothetical protein H8E88_24440 [candidate division KSB1 bacterium]|nr:hypothetical protein [candidate division KSB1 bacterium]MBL7093086.1 hypothetical protein [candidate division KSB1 bacterium]
MYLYETFKRSDTRIIKRFFITLILSINIVFGTSTFAAPEDTVTVEVKNPRAEARSIYQINFLISKPISHKAIIRVRFPIEFDLSKLLVAGSNTINGGFEMTVENDVVTIKRSGLGREIKANEKVDVKFAIVKNPIKADDNYSVQVEVFDDNNDSIIQKQETVKILPKIEKPEPLK